MHPPFVREKRKHPRVLAQELKLAEIEIKVAAAEDIARLRNEQASIVYSEPFPVTLDIVQPWDPRVVPYLEFPETAPLGNGVFELHQMANQATRARIFEGIMHARNLEADAEQRRIQAQESWNDLENVEARSRQTHRRGHLSRASIEAREAERQPLLEHTRPQSIGQDTQHSTNVGH